MKGMIRMAGKNDTEMDKTTKQHIFDVSLELYHDKCISCTLCMKERSFNRGSYD